MRLLRAFCRDESGNFAIIFLACAVMLIGAAGMAVDFSRANNARAAAQNVADSVALATAGAIREGMSPKDAKARGEDFYKANYGEIPFASDRKLTIKVTAVGNLYAARAVITGSTPSELFAILGRSTIDWKVEAQASFALRNLEIAVVADVSQSMTDDDMMAMRAALARFADTVLSRTQPGAVTTISLIPFAESVNFGDAYSAWLKSDDIGNFTGCFAPEPVTDMKREVPQTVGPGTYAALVSSVVAITNNQTCPQDAQMILQESNVDVLKTAIAKWSKGFGTGTDVALSWAWRSLSPKWRGRFGSSRYPLDYGVINKKVIVIFTDGEAIRYDPSGDGLETTKPWLDDPKNEITKSDAFAQTTADFTAVCEEIAAQGLVSVYAIAYQPDNFGPQKQVLRDCVANGGAYMEATDETLGDVMENIASNLKVIVLTK